MSFLRGDPAVAAVEVFYDETAYAVEREEGGLWVEALRSGNRGRFVEWVIEGNEDAGRGEAFLDIWAETDDGQFELLLEKEGVVLEALRGVLKAGARAHVFSLGSFERTEGARVKLSFSPLDYADNPGQALGQSVFRVGRARGLTDEEAKLRRERLETALVSAESLLSRAVVGSEEGMYPERAVEELAVAMAEARGVKGGGEGALEERERLVDAMVAFEASVTGPGYGLIDGRVTKETRYLFENLRRLSGRRMLFGMHDATGYGVGWKNDDDRSDVKDVCGDYPAIFSWDAFEVTFHGTAESLKYRMERAYRMGGVNTVCWHQYDPLGFGFYASSPPEGSYEGSIVSNLLPGGAHHGAYLEKLRVLGRFLKDLRGDGGESIPVIFRPYHEHNGDWFWWGAEHCTPEEYRAVWRFTVEYLRDELGVHNLIYAFSPDAGKYETEEGYFEIYPGDDYVDVLGFDSYWDNSGAAFKERFVRQTRQLARSARERGKLALLTEVGDRWDMKNGGERLATTDWYTRCLLDSVLTDEDTRGVVGAITWRNDNPNHHFAPYPGHPSVGDFLKFFEDPFTAFLGDLPALYVLPD